MPNLGKWNKAVVAGAGAVVLALTAALGEHSLVVQLVESGLTVLGVYGVKNA